ncbi:MAG: alpha/beta hydrolase [Betaproteobacteria bacterium]|nr:alpha/beta hydrolase [Betaproteobacteria bacterium]
MKKSESHFVNIRGLRYHVRSWGSPHAPRIFLLHGWMDVSASFQFLVDAFSREWHVIAPDWRGFGLTEWAREGYWFPDYYADLEALLDCYHPGEPVRLVGHSMGGVIASVYAGLRPQRVERLVSLEGLGLARHTPDQAPLRYAQWLDQLKDAPGFRPYRSFDAVAARLRKNNPRLTGERAAFLARHWAKQLDAEEIALTSDPRHKTFNPYLFRVEEAIACWRRITAPALLVSGKLSEMPARMKDTPEQLAERKDAFRDRREVELPDAGHMMHHDQPQRLARLIEEFFDGTPVPSKN